jgi:hypothetical protein
LEHNRVGSHISRPGFLYLALSQGSILSLKRRAITSLVVLEEVRLALSITRLYHKRWDLLHLGVGGRRYYWSRAGCLRSLMNNPNLTRIDKMWTQDLRFHILP